MGYFDELTIYNVDDVKLYYGVKGYKLLENSDALHCGFIEMLTKQFFWTHQTERHDYDWEDDADPALIEMLKDKRIEKYVIDLS